MRYLFWNTHRNQMINSTLCELIVENRISIVILAEYCAETDELIVLLADYGIEMKRYDSLYPRITMLGVIAEVEMKADVDAAIHIINGKDILCCVHLNSKIYAGHESDREIMIEHVIHDVQIVEKEIGTENSIIVGDFNINPYESACIDARYFHGIPVLAEAEKRTREVAKKEYSMFYNPMWNFFGDFTYPYGTYYYNNGKAQNTFWHIHDQVIFRPALKERFVQESLKILTATKTKYLLDGKGHPDKKISDHLPIMFEFMEEKSHG